MNKETAMPSKYFISQVENAAKINLRHHGLHTLLVTLRVRTTQD
jgi:hypothetical protein